MAKLISTEHARKALFIVSSTAQAEMFKPISEKLPDWNIIAINTDKWYKREEIEAVLERLNFPNKTISSVKSSAIKDILNGEKPDVIVVGHDRCSMDRLFIKCANSMGIPTLLVQDGILAASRVKTRETGNLVISLRYFSTLPYRAFSFMLDGNYSWHQKIELGMLSLKIRGKPGIFGHGECQKMALFGNAVKKMFISEGIDPKRIVLTGSPKFDQVYYSKDGNSKQLVCEKWDIPADKEIILLLTQYFVEAGIWSSEQRRSFVTAVANAVALIPNTQLIIKLHPPHENEEDYNEIIRNLSIDPIVCKYAPLSELLNACSLAITVSSTAALEAMVLGKPIVIVDLFDIECGSSFYKGSGSLYVEDELEILPALQKALYDPRTRENMKKSMDEFVHEQAYLQDGRASERISNLIRDMASCK